MDESPILPLGISRASLDDFDFVYALKCEHSNILWSGHSAQPDYANLRAWYVAQLSRLDRTIYVASCSDERVGILYLDTTESLFAEVSVEISERFQRKGLATQFIARLVEIADANPEALEIRAWISDENTASRAAFARNGFVPTGETRKVHFALKETEQTMRKYLHQRKR